MKAVRGSGRVPSKGPKGKKPGEKTRHRSDSQEPGTSKQGTLPKQSQKKKALAAAVPRKVKGQEKWKPLSKPSITALDNMLSLSILSVLATRRTEKQESQKHLNILKNKFLTSCVQLPVPHQKQGNMSHVSRQHQEESQKSTVGKKTQNMLEGEIDAVVSTLEKTEEQMETLEHQCSRLRQELEEEEEKAQEILQLPEQGVLHLPPLSRKDNETTLQERMLRLLPNANSCTAVARQLGGALRTSAPVQNARALLEHAHKHADQLSTPALLPTNSTD